MKRLLNKILYISLCIFLVTLSGCGDIKELQYLNYATAIGVDYRDGKYYSYIQLIGLDTIAKSEGAVSEKATMWVSEAVADTFNDAFFDVYKTSQERIIWSHVTAIVLSEDAIKEGFHNFFDGLTRYYEFRLTPWVFGTKEPIKEVLSTYGFYGKSSLETILHQPMRTYKQSSNILPIKLHQFAREIYEPAETASIPSLKIDKKQWEKDQESDPKLYIDGAFFIQNKYYKGFHRMDQIKGIRWLTPETKRASMLIPGEQESEFLIVFNKPKSRIETISSEGTPQFNIYIQVTGYYVNRNRNKTVQLEDIEEQSKKAISNEIREMYILGIEKEVDFLNLQHYLFREDYLMWKRLKKNSDLFINEDSLQNINIDLTIKHTGALKNQSINIDEIQ